VREYCERRDEVESASSSLSVATTPGLGRQHGRSASVLATYSSKVACNFLAGHPDIKDTALPTFYGLNCKLSTSAPMDVRERLDSRAQSWPASDCLA
jgi:hypothetical protein